MFAGHDYNFNAWKVEEVGGIPNCGSSENSAFVGFGLARASIISLMK